MRLTRARRTLPSTRFARAVAEGRVGTRGVAGTPERLEPRSEPAQAFVLVAKLAALPAADHRHAGRPVHETHGAICRVHRLAAGAGTPEDVHVTLGEQRLVGVGQLVALGQPVVSGTLGVHARA
jgi:hypothetical protein